MKIDRAYLLSLPQRPCESGLAAFDAAFPDGLLVEGEPDDATLDKLWGLDLAWFADTLPPDAVAAWERAKAEAEAAYKQAMAEAWANYRQAKAEAGAALERAEAEAGAAYARARAEALWRIVASLEVSS